FRCLINVCEVVAADQSIGVVDSELERLHLERFLEQSDRFSRTTYFEVGGSEGVSTAERRWMSRAERCRHQLEVLLVQCDRIRSATGFPVGQAEVVACGERVRVAMAQL